MDFRPDGLSSGWKVVANPIVVAVRATFQLQTRNKIFFRTVKLIGLLLFIACLHVSANSTAQKLSITLKNGSLEKLFTEIEHQTGFTFFYNVVDLQHAKPINIDVKDASVEAILQLSLKGQALSYFIQERTIFIKKEVPKMVSDAGAPDPGEAPPAFSGVVKSETGTPLAGATVYVPRLKRAATTDAKGVFVLKNMPDGEYEVEISFVGYATDKVKITVANHSGSLTAALKQSMSQLDETVVKGYYNTTERLNTGDVTTVKAEDIEKQPVSDPILALEGRVPGLNIQQTSGAPGSYATIEIRGQNSIANGNDPLYIVDGVPYGSASLTNASSLAGGALGVPGSTVGNMVGTFEGGGGVSPFNSLNPSDIESIEVLKDADATAIYGSRGANGVILITTKKGRAGNSLFDLNLYTGYSQVDRTLHLLNTQQYLAMRREGFQNDGLAVPSITANPMDNNYDLDGVWDTTRYTNWQKTLIGNSAKFTNAQGNLSGGNANTQFLIGAGYTNQSTVFIGNYSDQKASGHFSLTHSSTDQRFHAQLSVNYVYDKNILPQADFTSFITLAPDAPAIYNKDGSLNWQLRNGSATWTNPFGSTLDQASAATTNLISDFQLGYLLLKGLTVKSNFGYNHEQMNQQVLIPATSYAPPNNDNSYYRQSSMAMTDVQQWIVEPQLEYQGNISRGKLNILIGSTFEQNTKNNSAQYLYDFASDALISDPLAASGNILLNTSNSLYHYDAIFGRVGYNWEDKYLINITARRDGSSRFGPGRQFGNFGAIGGGWIFSKEDFVQNYLPFLSYGKLRISYGTTGNDQIGDYQYLSTYSSQPSTYQGTTGLYPTQLTNPYFAWETVKKLEAGLETGFFKDRILFSISYYRDRTGNQLVGYTLPVLTGFPGIESNLPAIVQNTGAEFVLNTINIKNKHFSWKMFINLTVPANKLVAYPNIASSPYSHTYIVGKPLSIRLMTHYTGVNPQSGNYTFETKNENGVPSYPQDLVSVVNIAQKFYGGWGNSFQYNRFQLDILTQFTKQSKFNYLQYFYIPGTPNLNEPTVVLGRWQHAGESGSIQKFTSGANNTVVNAYNALQSPLDDHTVSDGSFIRIKNVALSYELPAQWEHTTHLKSARMFIQCQNLFTVTKYLGLDPENAGTSVPPLRTITGGVRIGI